jgi:uncharacterized FAD-dependent dehydrogenase
MEDRNCPETLSCNCDPCDILEGGGGAGGFSDGKMTLSLTRGTQGEKIFPDECQVILDWIDTQLIRFGGEGVYYKPESRRAIEFEDTSLTFDSYPLRHMGSDGAQKFIINYVRHLEKEGVKFLWETHVDLFSQFNSRINGVFAHSKKEKILQYGANDRVVIATGLQGSPWFENHIEELRETHWEQGPAGFGIRIEAKKEILDPLFSRFYDFKVEGDFHGMHLRSFCCNRGGYVCNENHTELGVRNVNGHSYLNPEMKTGSSNFALIAKVPVEFAEEPQTSVRVIARKINQVAEGHTAVQLTRDFIKGSNWGTKKISSYPFITNKQSYPIDIAEILPSLLRNSFKDYLIEMNKAIPGIISGDSCVYAPEIKYYGKKVPVSFDTWLVDGFENLHVIGNATGYLDSFVSCALTGILVAQYVNEGRE